MTKLVGPMMSLSATGGFGDTLFYYDSKDGPVVRQKKRIFTVPSQVWYVNNQFFKVASARAKHFTSDQKRAWKKAYKGICDSWRDIYMGQQIEAWNASPENDLDWPNITISPTDPYQYSWDNAYGAKIEIMLNPDNHPHFNSNVVHSRWIQKLDDPNPPTGTEEYIRDWKYYHQYTPVAGKTNYYWHGILWITGNLTYNLALTKYQLW